MTWLAVVRLTEGSLSIGAHGVTTFSVGRDRDEEGINSFPYYLTGNAPKGVQTWLQRKMGRIA